MSITVVFQNESGTVATVTRSPNWLARVLLGRRESTREVFDAGWDWVYSHDDRAVEPDVERAIERALDQRAVRRAFEERMWGRPR